MSTAPSTAILRHLHSLARGHVVTHDTDNQLLQAFAAGSEDAFASMVRRYGPLVWGVCRRLLRCEQDAEDAFQATFLVLARRPDAIRQPGALAAFLHGVARRVALKMRTGRARERERELPPDVRTTPQPAAEAAWRELQELIDDEVARLPEKYREPFILCCLQGHSKAEAARVLGWKEGTVSSRLDAARQRLRRQLARRGVGLTAALTVLALMPKTRAAPPALVAHVVRRTFSLTATARAHAVMRGLTAARRGWIALLVATGLAIGGAGFMATRAIGAFVDDKSPPTSSTPEAAANGPVTSAELRRDALGDALPPGAIARFGTVRYRQGGRASSLAFSPDGRELISGGEDGYIRLFDAATGKVRRRLRSSGNNVSVALSPDGRVLAARAWDHVIHLYDEVSGTELRTLPFSSGAMGTIAFSADGKFLAAVCGRSIRTWDVATGERQKSIGPNIQGWWCLAVSHDGKSLACGDATGKAYVWDLATAKEVRRFPTDEPFVTSLTFSPDGRTLVGAVGDAGLIYQWDISSGKVIWKIELPEGGQPTVAFSPDGRFVAVGGGKVVAKRPCPVRLLDSATGKEVRCLGLHQEHISALVFSKDGQKLASASFDGMIGLWDVATGKDLRLAAGHTSTVVEVALSPDGRTLASASRDRTVRLWSLPDGKELRTLGGNEQMLQTVAFTPDGRTVIAADFSDVVSQWDAATGVEIRRLPGSEGRHWRYAFSPDRKTLLGASMDGFIRLRDLATGRELQNYAGLGLGLIPSVAFSEDGKFVAAVREDAGRPSGALSVWDAATAERKIMLDVAGGAQEVAFSPDGRTLAATGKVGAIHLWDFANGKLLGSLPGALDDPCGSWRRAPLAFAADGRSLVGATGRTLRLWEVVSGKERCCLRQEFGWPACLTLSRDGFTLFTGGNDNAILAWDLIPPGTARPRARLSERQAETLWTELASDDATVAYRALCTLIIAGDRAVDLLRSRLRPAVASDPGPVDKLVADLDSDRFETRERAASELEKKSRAIEPQLRKALQDSSSAEVRRRIRELLDKLESAALPPSVVREVRAIEALERIGSPEASAVLKKLAAGAVEARVTREATASLQRRQRGQ
jgi:RNA polymerase sigma factor (sigma-70 family)